MARKKASPIGLLQIFRRFSPQIRAEKKLLAASTLALVGEVAMRLLEPWPLKFVIDHVLGPDKTANAVHPWLRGESPGTLIAIAAGGIVLFGALRAGFAYVNTVGLALVGNRVLSQVRADLYRHLQALSLSFHTRERGGELIIRVINDVGMLKDATVSAMLPFLTNILMVVGMIGVMLWLDWRLALLALTTLPLFWWRTGTLTRKLRRVAREQRRREGAMAATAAESMGAIKVVKALSLESVFAREFAAQNAKSLADGAKAKRLEAALERTVDVLIAISSALVVWLGARFVMQGALTVGALVVFLAYLRNAFKPVRDFAKYTGRLAKAAAAGERVLEVLDRAPELRDRPGAIVAPPLAGDIRFAKVSFAYDEGHPVLRDLDLHLPAGECLALVGESGSGKSTIASLLLRLYQADAGTLFVDDREVADYTIDSLRSQMSVVLQDTLLFSGTISENIAFGVAGAGAAQIEKAARVASADGFISSLPAGYDTRVGERGVTLSSGQRQRIAIARAAVRSTPILVLDEPTTGLDEHNRSIVAAALERLSLGRTTLLITHDLSLTPMASRIVYLDRGEIVESGTHAELLAAHGRYAKVFTAQTRAHASRRTTPGGNALIA